MKRSNVLVALLGVILAGVFGASASEDQQTVLITSFPKDLQVYVIPWSEWEKIKEEVFIPAYSLETKVAIIISKNRQIIPLYYLSFSEQRVELVDLTQNGKFVFVCPGVVYWKHHALPQGGWLRKRLFVQYTWGKTPTERTAKPGEYAILLVRDLSNEELRYRSHGFHNYPDWENLLPPAPALEYGISVRGFDPTVYQFITLYKVRIQAQQYQCFHFACDQTPTSQ